MNHVVLYDSSNTKVEFINDMVDLGSFGTQMVKTFDTPQKNVIASIVLPRGEELRITFKMKGEVVNEYYAYEPQYSSVYMRDAFDEIIFDVTNLYGVPEEEFINHAYIEYPEEYFEDWYDELSGNFAQDITIGNNEFSSKFASKKEQWMVTSIAYDSNWTVKINGEPVKVEKVNGGFIGFIIPEGNLVIEGNFYPREMTYGLIISVISLLLLILIKNKQWL